MAFLIDTRTGPAIQADGSGDQPLRQGRMGALIVADAHGRYFETASRKNLFTAYSTATAMTVAGTAMVGLQVWNGSPVTNGVNLVLLKAAGFIFVTSATTTGVLLCTGTGQVSAPTTQTAITRVTNNYIGGAGPQASAMNAGTFTNAPTAMLNLMHNTAAIATTGEDIGFSVDLEGSIIIPPQCYVAFAALGATAAAASTNLHLMWEEVPA